MAVVIVFGRRTFGARVDRFAYAGEDWFVTQPVFHVCCIPICPIANAFLSHESWDGNRGFRLPNSSCSGCCHSFPIPCGWGLLSRTCGRGCVEATPERKLELINFIRTKRKQPRFATLEEIPEALLRGRTPRTGAAAAAAPATRDGYSKIAADADADATEDPEQPPAPTPTAPPAANYGATSATNSGGYGAPTASEGPKYGDATAPTKNTV